MLLWKKNGNQSIFFMLQIFYILLVWIFIKEIFILSFVRIIVNDNICKRNTSLHIIYFPYVQISVNITEDIFRIDGNLQHTCRGVNDYIEFMFC